MAISEEVRSAAALALSEAARQENIYLPFNKAARLVEPVIDAVMAIARRRSPDMRIERNRAALRASMDE